MEALKTKTTNELIELFILTGKMIDKYIPTVRGWIMDELELRNPAAFDEWLDKECEDEALYNYFN